jgi:hypothetical protein
VVVRIIAQIYIRDVDIDSQNKSPMPAPSTFFSWRIKIVHNHSGYSSSGSATGSCLFFSKFSPFSGVPAGMLLFTRGVTFFFAASVAWPFRLAEGAGVRGSLKGWAADVDVAAGGVCEDVAAVEVAEMGVALWRRDEVVRKRGDAGDGRALEAARRQARQIMVGGCWRTIGDISMLGCSSKVWHGC